MSADKNIILFDFDGVVANSFGLAFAVNKMIFPDIIEAEYRQAFEGNINDWVKEKMHSRHRTDVDFVSTYARRADAEVTLVSGMKEVLTSLAARYLLIVVSSSTSDFIHTFNKKHELAIFFTEVLGNDVHKSKIEKIAMVKEKYHASPGRYVFVTDTLGDAREADHHGIGVIGVSWGFHDHTTLSKDHAITIVDRPEELSKAVDDYFTKAQA
jgi:phosphoglycolate phosphatase-like HAD superfamily hydrolase